jgi:hypothetical protein
MRRLTMMGGLAALATLASASTCYDANNYIVTPASAKARLQLSSSSPTVPADGFSRVTITAQVDTTADATRRSVKFTTTAGRLVGGPDIVADASGVATVELESAVPEQNATVRADVNGVAGLAQSIVVKFIAVIPDAIIKFITLPKAAIADGDELETIAVQIGAGVPTDKRSVKFTASSGTFPNNAPTSPMRRTSRRSRSARRSASVRCRFAHRFFRSRVTAPSRSAQRCPIRFSWIRVSSP